VAINILCDVVADVADVNMTPYPLTSDDRTVICALRVEKQQGVLRMMKEFLLRQWKCCTLNDLIKRMTKLALSRVAVDLSRS